MTDSLFGFQPSAAVEVSEPKRQRSQAEQDYLDMEARNRAEKIVQALRRNSDGDDLMRGIANHLLQHVNNNKGGR